MASYRVTELKSYRFRLLLCIIYWCNVLKTTIIRCYEFYIALIYKCYFIGLCLYCLLLPLIPSLNVRLFVIIHTYTHRPHTYITRMAHTFRQSWLWDEWWWWLWEGGEGCWQVNGLSVIKRRVCTVYLFHSNKKKNKVRLYNGILLLITWV